MICSIQQREGVVMAINTMAKLRAVYRPPAPRAGLKVLDHLDVHCRNFIALSPPSMSSVPPALTGGPMPPHGAIRQGPWRTYWTTRRCCCPTVRGTVRWTR